MKKCIVRFVASVFLASSVSCAKPERVRIPVASEVCQRTVLADNAENIKTRQLEPDTWYSLLLSNYDPIRNRTSGRPRHCDGELVAVAPFPVELNCAKGPFLGRKIVRDSGRLKMDRLVRQEISENEELVWLQTHVDDNDDALGPLAKVVWGKKSVKVRPMGTLAAHRNGVQLRLVGEDEPLLAVESDRCGKGPRDGCVRELRVRVLRDGQYQNLPMVGAERKCEGEFAMTLEDGRPVKIGAHRVDTYEVTRNLQDLAQDGVAILEVSHASRRISQSAKAVEPETSSLRRRVEVRDDHVFVQPGVIEELARLYPVKQGKGKGKRRGKGKTVKRGLAR